ncbi:response regulator transcription factor [Litoribrevibacter albus]|uniref:HTH luxR-type domain-containing protein n=1 Tax=Litoribrevibacter albus TaxID=1473156 RepID=A0AA37SAL5_9GAMM|nr:LuxR C-terminal-related transcriptional regulator [Litoribrevibacter albus]GLQ31621.1 hypothetical protein GCM10007876_21000 [Litoribrevibacter albus]
MNKDAIKIRTVQGNKNQGLADRELEASLWSMEGLSNKEIAKEMKISPYTVSKRLMNAMFKMGVDNRTELAVVLLRKGIVEFLCLALLVGSVNYAMNLEGVEPVRIQRSARVNSNARNRREDFLLLEGPC